MGRLLTATELLKIGVPMSSDNCTLCATVAETTDHLFAGCGFTFGVLSAIGWWCGYSADQLGSIRTVRDPLQLHKLAAGDKTVKNVVYGIWVIAVWALWSARNRKIFNKKEPFDYLDLRTAARNVADHVYHYFSQATVLLVIGEMVFTSYIRRFVQRIMYHYVTLLARVFFFAKP